MKGNKAMEKKIYVILVGRGIKEDGVYWEVLWYSKKSDQYFATQLVNPNVDGSKELEHFFTYDEAVAIVSKFDLKKKYDVVEINESVEFKRELKKELDVKEKMNELLIFED